jgi:FdhD protein
MNDMGIIVSGRTSFELMQKALTAACPMVVAVGAPSSLAVELAQEFNITLVGFLGNNSFNIYHNPDAIL